MKEAMFWHNNNLKLCGFLKQNIFVRDNFEWISVFLINIRIFIV